ncbi:hypothetical protein [Flammeovirga aprica]|uniref:Uncharacterized protein n=1 Tax=Flammeovirga aprica JL-4 TaxID=694437 RepID=A0A7X9P1Y6_9BACT|nr:hypothetical protein [Flammeovirga aprica]NME67537.1 hypothetical protein [Flammeovirga aprica JL-4]
MKSPLLINLLLLVLLVSCGFDPNDFNDIGVKPLESKSVAVPLLDGNVELQDLLSKTDQSHLHTDQVPWYLEYKSWETQAQKDTVTPLVTGTEILNDEYFKLQTGLQVPLLTSFENIIINKEVVLPINTVNPFFDVNILTVSDGQFNATFRNKGLFVSSFMMELIQYNNSDTTVLQREEFQLQPNNNSSLTFQITNAVIHSSNNRKTALRFKNTIRGNNAPYTIEPSPAQGISINEVGGIHFTPFVDVDLNIPFDEKFMNISIFDNTLEDGGVTLSDFQLDVVSYNTFGLDIFAGEIEVFAQSSIDSSLTPIVFTSTQIGRPRNQFNEKVDTLSVLKPEAALSLKPNKLIMKGNLQIKMRKGVDYFIEADSYIKEQFVLQIPFKLGMDNVTFSTTIVRQQDVQESIDILDSATVRIAINNYFPMDGILSIYTKNEMEDIAPYQIDLSSEANQNDFVFMKAAVLDENDLVTAPTMLQNTFRITRDDARRILQANYIYVEGRFSTPDGKVIPFVPGHRLLIKAGIFASVTLSPDDL